MRKTLLLLLLFGAPALASEFVGGAICDRNIANAPCLLNEPFIWARNVIMERKGCLPNDGLICQALNGTVYVLHTWVTYEDETIIQGDFVWQVVRSNPQDPASWAFVTFVDDCHDIGQHRMSGGFPDP